jgi:hypothetical protein
MHDAKQVTSGGTSWFRTQLSSIFLLFFCGKFVFQWDFFRNHPRKFRGKWFSAKLIPYWETKFSRSSVAGQTLFP